MRLKGVNSFEQHVEKFVVAAVAIVVLGIVTWQVIGSRSVVKVGTGDVPLDQAYPKIEQKAREVQGKISRTDPALPAELQLGTLGDFEAKLHARVSRADQIVWTGGARTGGGGGIDIPTDKGGLRIAAMKIPTTGNPVAQSYLATIRPGEIEEAPELKKYLPPQMPYDKAGVSVEATFDGAALAKVLGAAPEGTDKMPTFWWDSTQILAIELQRQEMQAGGAWGPVAPVVAMPGRTDMLDAVKPGAIASTAKLKELVQFATDNAEIVRRPPYYALLLGDDWVPPTEVKAVAVVNNRAKEAECKRLVEQKDEQIQATKDQIAKLGGGGRAQPTAPGQTPKPDPVKKPLEDKLKRLETERAKIIENCRKDGVDLEPAPATSAPAGPGPDVKRDGPLLSGVVRLWAHDISAVRGKTYRYRLSVILSNPVFGHAAGLVPEQAEMAKSPTIRSEDSGWSEPVRLPEDMYYFITAAQDGAAGGGAVGGGTHASAELFAFAWGYWRRGSVSLEPGDAVAGTVRVPDLEKLLTTKPEAPGMPEPPRPRPGGGGEGLPPPPGGGGKGGGGGAIGPPPGGRDDRGGPPTGGPGGDKDKPEQVKFKEVPVSRDAYLLDVAAIPAAGQGLGAQAAGGTQYQAILRDSGGEIVIRVPEAERVDAEYQRILASALKGEDAVRPKQEPKRTLPPPRPDQTPRPVPGGGGGGGGKGGGGG